MTHTGIAPSTTTAPGNGWGPSPATPGSSRWVVVIVIIAVVAGLAFAWWLSENRSESPSDPTPTLPGLSGGETFEMESRTEMWVSGVLITAHSGSNSSDWKRATYSVSGPGFTTIEVQDVPNTVVTVPGWGQLTVERVRTTSRTVDLKPGETGAIEPTATLYFRAVTDFPLVAGSQEFPTDD